MKGSMIFFFLHSIIWCECSSWSNSL